jgi:D-3-phosphoglycerate dehydrogenase
MTEKARIVFLDRNTMPESIKLNPPGFPHELTVFDETAPDQVAARIAEADVVITNKVRLGRAEIDAAPKLRLIAVAATGYDVIDLDACKARGITVSNIRNYAVNTVPEHTFALILALRRSLVPYRQSVVDGRWQQSGKFCYFDYPIGDLAGSTLGIIGDGVLGRAVADIARGFGMKVLFSTYKGVDGMGPLYTPYEDVLRRSDIITLHLPLMPSTRNMIGAADFALMARRPLLINTARGGLVDEDALADAIEAGHVAGAALDVFETEPATASRLFALENVVCTPHLGAATTEAQENVALQVAEQMSDFLLTGAVSNAINMPSVSAEDAPRLKPYMELCRLLGAFAGQLTQAREGVLTRVLIEYEGQVAALNQRPLTAAALAGLMSPAMEGVNMVNAPVAARDHGIEVSETVHDRDSEYQTLVRVTVESDRMTRSVSGTLFAGSKPRIVEIKGIKVEADFGRHMLYVTNQDKPGFIGRFGALLADAGINIATFNLGRAAAGGDAICLVSVDEKVPESVLADVRALPLVVQATPLAF